MTGDQPDTQMLGLVPTYHLGNDSDLKRSLIKVIKYFLAQTASGDATPTNEQLEKIDRQWELRAEDVDGRATRVFLVERSVEASKAIDYVDAQGTLLAVQISQVRDPSLAN